MTTPTPDNRSIFADLRERFSKKIVEAARAELAPLKQELDNVRTANYGLRLEVSAQQNLNQALTAGSQLLAQNLAKAKVNAVQLKEKYESELQSLIAREADGRLELDDMRAEISKMAHEVAALRAEGGR